jgi:uncharacterized protein YndB with AHSA1/START domain
MTNADATTERIVLRRTYDAPRERVFRAWTDVAEMRHWYSPDPGFVVQRAEGDIRTGGRAEFAFGPPGEEPYVETNRYREVISPERLVFEMTLSRGGQVHSKTIVTMEFRDLGGRTEVIVTDVGPGAEEHRSGWEPTLDSFARRLAGRA